VVRFGRMRRDLDADAAAEGVVHALLLRYAADRAAGRAPDVAAYRAQFPGHEDLVERELTALAAGDAAGHASSPSDDAEERVGPWILERELGRGGQGSVFLARDTRLPRRAALKRLRFRGRFAADADEARFRREAAALARLDHPGLASVIEAGRDGDDAWIAMRYVEGATLAERLRTAAGETAAEGAPGSPATPRGASRAAALEAARLVEACARALHAAHEAGVVHRDVKPGNVVVTASGDPVVVDFGLALDAAAETAVTQSGDVLGTPAYMAPEQVDGRRGSVDRRADVYALGVTLYEACVGRRPFAGPTAEALYRAILHDEPVAPRRLAPAVPRDLETAILAATAKEPARRYATALDFAEDLRRVRAGEPIAARPISAVGRAARFARRRPAAAALIAVLALGAPIVAALGGHYYATRDDVAAVRAARAAAEREARLGAAFIAVGEGDAAEGERALLAELGDPAAAAEALAGALMARERRGDPRGALALAAAHPHLLARDPALRLLVADAHRALGDEAAARAEERAAGPPRTAFDRFVVGVRLVRDGHERPSLPTFRAAAAALAEAWLFTPAPRALFGWELLHAEGHVAALEIAEGAADVPRVRAVADAVAARWPDELPTHFWTAHGLLDVDLPAAESATRRILEREPLNGRALANLARLRANQGDVAAALTHFERALARFPGEADLLADYAFALGLASRPADALAASARSFALPTATPGVRAAHADRLVESGRAEEAVRLLGARARVGPERDAYADALRATGDVGGALRELEAAAAEPDASGLAWARVAEAREEAADAAGAADAWRRAAERAGGDHGLRVAAAERLRAAGVLDGALDAAAGVPAGAPERPRADAVRKDVYARLFGAASRAAGAER
jgi:tRNA A-37 threonylcarbamoyl transferase component Bud32/tetratricopeptide (TPR) repeat protein